MPLAMLFVGAVFTYLIGSLYRRVVKINQSVFSGTVATIVLVTVLTVFYQLATGVIITRKGIFVDTFAAYYNAANLSSYSVLLKLDPLGVFMAGIALVTSLLVVVYSAKYMEHDERPERFFVLFILMVAGMVGLALSGDLFNMYLFFELMAIASYVLVAFRKTAESIEASFKYLVMSSAGTMLALFGISLVYQMTGHLSLDSIHKVASTLPSNGILLAVAFIITGFGVKTAMVPLHFWLPDAHSAAPSGISAMLSGVVIEMGLLTMLKALMVLPLAGVGLVLAIMAVITMTVGNFMALVQTDIKRLLAYSSVAQIGYILLGIGIGMHYGLASGMTGGLFHIMNHAFMKGGAFLVAGAFIHYTATRNIEDLKGIASKMPLSAICFTIACLSLAGIPPFSGFMSKLMIYKAGVQMGCALGYFFTFAAIFNSILSCGYYLPLINTIFSRERSALIEKAKNIVEAPFLMTVPVIVMTFLTVALGVFPDIGVRIVKPAVVAILEVIKA